jgi:hypothetical protein
MNTHISQIKAEIVANGGVTNFGSWLAMALHQYKFAIVGDWENPELSMSDECIESAYRWLAYNHGTAKPDFIYETVLKEWDDDRAVLLADALYTGDLMPLKRTVVEDLVLNGGHFRQLCEQCFGPDRRRTVESEINRDLDEEKAKDARAA